ncbi:HEPN domain-containing protein [Pseudidiomarina sp.]|uniref:HEPN domain-containing protein n=1 Tax=Pseudidiomarina sp. TaxID=2081707 RepID=UPI00299D39E6|nr:HEPN domain-containing protein [Pseudidiomarina sp.]MDX1706944.1 HEPN domain-containing protein [Pseudidiomarina sp.]
MKTHAELKEYQREHRDNWQNGLSLRVHRALSWLHRAEQEQQSNDTDAEFIFLWIGFNAAYASEHAQETRNSTRDSYTQFFERLTGYDADNELYELVWTHYPQAIRSLMNNKFVFHPYWDSANRRLDAEAWKQPFDSAKRAAHTALAQQDVVTCLSIVMDRLYTLRNQLIHGGSTWNGSLNRDQLRDATHILRSLLPIVIKLMMLNGEKVWGDAAYFDVED